MLSPGEFRQKKLRRFQAKKFRRVQAKKIKSSGKKMRDKAKKRVQAKNCSNRRKRRKKHPKNPWEMHLSIVCSVFMYACVRRRLSRFEVERSDELGEYDTFFYIIITAFFIKLLKTSCKVLTIVSMPILKISYLVIISAAA